jgi:O-antigen/teichoic acid export membrane protein
MPITIATGMAMTFLGPILYQYAGDATDNSRNKKTNRIAWRLSFLSVALAILGFLITALIHEEVFTIFVAEEFRDCSKYLPWIVLAGGLFASGQMLALKLMSDMKPEIMTKAKIITAIIGFTLNLVGAIVAGMQGVIIAQLIFASVYLIWMMLLANSSATLNKNIDLIKF